MAWRVFTHAVVGAIAAIAVIIYYHIPRDAYRCAEQSQPISQNNGYTIDMVQKLCGGMAYSDTISLVMHSERSAKGTTFFSYERGSSDPKLSWQNNNVLLVEVPDVGEIDMKVDHVEDVQIRYDIGKVVAK